MTASHVTCYIHIIFITVIHETVHMMLMCDTFRAAEASHILESEADLLDMPKPLPTIEELDHRRNLMKLSRQ